MVMSAPGTGEPSPGSRVGIGVILAVGAFSAPKAEPKRAPAINGKASATMIQAISARLNAGRSPRFFEGTSGGVGSYAFMRTIISYGARMLPTLARRLADFRITAGVR